MPNSPETFWSESINPAAQSVVKAMLRQQAIGLGQITKNIVTADIDSTVVAENASGFINPPNIIHSFDIIAPLLGYQRFTLFYIAQIIGLEFPITFHSKMLKQVPLPVCNNLGEFNTALREILSSKESVDLINSIIEQSS